MLAFTEYLTKPRRGRLALYGGFGALYGAAAMSLIRLGLRRAGLIDKMVPQTVTEWASQKLGVEPPGVPAGHPAADQLLHFVYSVTWGALAAPVLFATGRRRPAPKGDQRHRSPSLAPVGFNDQPIGWVIDPGVARRAITASSM
jgi:hypothetical protein